MEENSEKQKITLRGVDWILMAMEQQEPMFDNYIHLPTGAVWNEECGEEMIDEIDEEDLYPLAPFPSHEGFRVMEKFARHEVKCDAVQSELFKALDQKKPFRRFKDVLSDHPDVYKQFDLYKDARMLEHLLSELKEDGYEVSVEEG